MDSVAAHNIGVKARQAAERIAELFEQAKPIPLSGGQLRIDKATVRELMASLRPSLAGEDTWTLDELETVLKHARQVPLTDMVRIHGDQAEAFARRFRAIAARV